MSNYRGDRFNSEGYFSPTEYEAIRRIERDERKAKAKSRRTYNKGRHNQSRPNTRKTEVKRYDDK